MSCQRIVEDSPPIELQAESQYDDSEPPVGVARSGPLHVPFLPPLTTHALTPSLLCPSPSPPLSQSTR